MDSTFLSSVSHVRCRVPARRPGDFGVRITSLREVSGPPLREHLLAQMKVTKAKGLNTDLGGVLGCDLERSLAQRCTSDRFLADPSSRCDFIGRKSPMATRHCSDDLFGQAARNEALDLQRSNFEPQEIRRRPAASKSARKRPDLLGEAKPEALSKEMFAQIGIQALCFGDFHLCRQMKVTRPPGRDPAPDSVNRPPGRDPATPAREATCFV